MMLTELGPLPVASLPVQALKDHLRLGTGFADAALQDGLLADYLRAALAAIEGRIGKVLITRDFKWVLADWRSPQAQALPVAPVTAILSLVLRRADGAVETLSPDRYRLVPDTHRPRLEASASALPLPPSGGQIEITFTAGFGPDWADLPADLAQAVLRLAADYYETRHDSGARQAQGLPQPVVTLIERWRNVRVLGGGAA